MHPECPVWAGNLQRQAFLSRQNVQMHNDLEWRFNGLKLATSRNWCAHV